VEELNIHPTDGVPKIILDAVLKTSSYVLVGVLPLFFIWQVGEEKMRYGDTTYWINMIVTVLLVFLVRTFTTKFKYWWQGGLAGISGILIAIFVGGVLGGLASILEP